MNVGTAREPAAFQTLVCFIYTDAQPAHPLHPLPQPESEGKIRTRLQGSNFIG